MSTFKEFYAINEDVNESIKNEMAARNIAQIINLSTNKYVRNATVRGQREGTHLTVIMHNGDVFDVIPNFSHNIISKK